MRSAGGVDAARAVLERRGEVPEALLSGEIGASWNRCLQAGLDPTRAPRTPGIDAGAWREARMKHERARRLARCEMEELHGQIAGSNFLIAFASPDGTVLDAISDDSFRGPAQDRALEPRSCWKETLRGTNAMGLAATLRRPAVVHGAEHFFRADAGLTCVAEPVWGANGTLAGILDASTSSTTRQLHTRALLRMAAGQIGNALFRDRHRDRLILAIHNREEFLFTSGAGLLALDADGQILDASAQATVMLHGLPAEAGQGFAAVFAGRFGDAVARRTAGEAFRLRDRSGASFCAAVVARVAGAVMAGAGGAGAGGVASAWSSGATAAAETAAVAARAAAAAVRAPAGFVAEDPVLARAVALAAAAARRRLPILVEGET
ncbi:MAG: GAF domain-containing protein, partial [Gluconacetobacter diazotrophicus]|nr:GAF domain-containing protein [Gluconacetobacter diazotrophicus]